MRKYISTEIRSKTVTALPLTISAYAAKALAVALFLVSGRVLGLAFGLAGALSCVVFFAYRALGLRAIVPLVAILGLAYAFMMPYFSPIDEENHFGLTRFITVKHALPQVDDYTPKEVLAMADHVYPKDHNKEAYECGLEGRMYEAQHPPLYYLAAALLSVLIPGGLIVKLYALRVIGVLCLVATTVLLIKTYRFAVDRELIPRSDGLFYVVLALILFSPGLVLRMATVSNINLSLPLSALMLYLLVRLLSDNESELPRRCAALGATAGALAVSQILCGVFAPVAGAVVLLRTRSLRSLLLFVLPFALILGLWIAYNFHTYGEPTAFSKARVLIEPVTNPVGNALGLGFIKKAFPRFLETLWAPEDSGNIHRWGWVLAWSLSVVGFAAIAIAAVRAFLLRNRKDSTREITLVCLAAMTLNAILVLYESGWTWQGALLGRYIYATLPCMVFVLYLAAGRVRVAWAVLGPAIVAVLVLYVTVLANMIAFRGRYPL